ncbi:MAG: cyclic nucleotide-binding domain-containing protein [Planctomycetota bacterium]|jgi:CRP-like cAMP-binding protein
MKDNVPSPSYKDLRKYCYFHRLSDEALKKLLKKMFVKEIPAGDVIIKEGQTSDAFYFISDGEIEVSKKTASGETTVLSVLGKGEGIGVMALLTSSNRNATVTAKIDTVCYILLKDDFNEIVRKDAVFSSLMREKVFGHDDFSKIKTLQPFELLEPEKIVALSDKLSELKYMPGKDIVVQGERGNRYFIIKSGSVEVLKKMFSDDAEKVATCVAGQGFGEEALITDSPRNATVRAVDETVVWALAKPDFDLIMKSSFLEEVPPEDVRKEMETKHQFLDVRMDMEFEDEHIPGAINIPLDELRQRYSELHRDREYYVYCLVGARSASATFLLRSQGFKAKSIKGGLNSWPGPLTEGTDGVHAPFKPT